MNKTTQKIRIIPLGGVGELGKNMYVIEVEDDLFVIDAGLMYPEDEMFGIDIVIPDITYLLENRTRLRGIFLSHGHEDHTGALIYFLDKLSVPIFGTKLTLALTKEKLQEKIVDYHMNSVKLMRTLVFHLHMPIFPFFG